MHIGRRDGLQRCASAGGLADHTSCIHLIRVGCATPSTPPTSTATVRTSLVRLFSCKFKQCLHSPLGVHRNNFASYHNKNHPGTISFHFRLQCERALHFSQDLFTSMSASAFRIPVPTSQLCTPDAQTVACSLHCLTVLSLFCGPSLCCRRSKFQNDIRLHDPLKTGGSTST